MRRQSFHILAIFEKEDRENVYDDAHPGRLSTSTTNENYNSEENYHAKLSKNY